MPDNDLLSVTLYLPTKATGLSRAENLGETTGARSSIMGNGLRVHKNRIEAEQTPDIKTIDLYILAALACVWMYRDGKSRGKGLGYLIPFFILTAVFVSAGPLLYLVLRGGREPEAEASKI